MNKKQFVRILRRYLKGNATEEERGFIEAYYSLFEGEPGFEELLSREGEKQVGEAILEEIWQRVSVSGGSPPAHVAKRKNIIPGMVKAAAAVLVLLASSLIIYKTRINRHPGDQTVAQAAPGQYESNIQPGGNHAVLTLANGKKVILDSMQNGTVGQQGNTQIFKLNNGLLSYRKSATGRLKPNTQYNTIATPEGGKYEVVLPDGSKVWLNAASSLRFPVRFSGNTREVTVSGEAYFEVAARPKQPFVVQVGGYKVEVLGTHFNVNAYDKKSSIRTTLIEGSVKVTEGDRSLLLKPGEQVRTNEETRTFSRMKVNIDEVTAWKNDLFYFNKTNIRDIMREIARWYNVSVVYKTKDLRDKNYSGIMSRYSNVNAILKRMELTRTIHFKVTGRTVTVMN